MSEPTFATELERELYEALTHALGLIVEFGDLNGFRNLSDEELGRAVIATAEEAKAALSKARGETKQ